MTFRKNKLLSLLLPALGLMNTYIVEDDDGTPPSDSTSGAVGTENDKRLALLSAINDRNDEANADELADVNDDGSVSAFTRTKADDSEEEPETALSDPDKDTAIAAPAPTPEPAPVTKIKVNGEEVELTPELIAKAQKIASADKYLEEAAAARKTPAPTPEPTPATRTPAPDVEEARLSAEEEVALVRAIQMGTEEEAVNALRKLRQSTQVGVTKEAVAATVDERLAFQTALAWFEDEYDDLVKDPQLHQVVLQRDQQLLRDGDKRGYRERYKAVGDEVRAWRDDMVSRYTKKDDPAPSPVTAPAAAPAPTMQDRQRKKEAAPAMPTPAAGRAATPGEDDETDENASDVIAKMAASRGGPQWARA